MDNKDTSDESKNTESTDLEEGCNELKKNLQDIKIITRDVEDFSESRKAKKKIKTFSQQIDEFCSEGDDNI